MEIVDTELLEKLSSDLKEMITEADRLFTCILKR